MLDINYMARNQINQIYGPRYGHPLSYVFTTGLVHDRDGVIVISNRNRCNHWVSYVFTTGLVHVLTGCHISISISIY